MKILLTGGAGYLGNIVTRKLLDQKHEVVIIDNLIHGSEGCTGLFQIQLILCLILFQVAQDQKVLL